ncbi:hypothetical protein ACFWXO_32615 [Kitasatospora sp. NPDC059088]|uniref:hypothetical protein n=1 Tax=Kitasatospora sp. NPDC059088 TaxID=3346722 RepID=UPI0036978EBC
MPHGSDSPSRKRAASGSEAIHEVNWYVRSVVPPTTVGLKSNMSQNLGHLSPEVAGSWFSWRNSGSAKRQVGLPFTEVTTPPRGA